MYRHCRTLHRIRQITHRLAGLFSGLLLGIFSAVPALALAAPAQANVQVAVAANFLGTARVLARAYEQQHATRILLSSGSTGKLYAQIRHGAPYAIFLAADARRPRLLEQAGLIAPGSRFTYAVGRLVLWSRQPDLFTAHTIVPDLDRILSQEGRLAIANPATAPYGAAAEAVLKHLGKWQAYQSRLVRGENVGQTLQFAVTGNANAAFVALAQVADPQHPLGGSHWLVPGDWYPRIAQQAVLLKTAAADPAARQFYAFLRSKQAQAIITRHGYGVVAHTP